MELYDAIFYRKSIRNYSNKQIKIPLMESVKDICSNITYLNKDLNIKAHVIDRGHLIHFLMGKGCKVKAPHYIVVTSNKGNDYLQNIGFAIENVVLKLTTLGLATCWLECNLKREDILEFVELEEIESDDEDYEKKLEYPVAIIAFGYPEKSESLFRPLNGEPDRERVKHISKNLDRKWIKILNAVRVAPSIKNCQPWMFYGEENIINIYEEKQKKAIENMSKISMGIALKHFDIACKKFDIKVKYAKKKHKNKMSKEYFISIVDVDNEYTQLT
ncbi:hypothetical protein CHF27_010495 [Romboutsia maritimum]|uniref:Putative nitroreductase TM1586 domain-containing protein n=1 Tax=Romboutsia maritimum TaxID=2020948 RepID=A0A371IRA6_9FIRM|nr:nitroreductase family protein [Romboutsia maritimum]RDY23012.1 hypothetical protein CHF27_010495 [Romboutsia maritimum]